MKGLPQQTLRGNCLPRVGETTFRVAEDVVEGTIRHLRLSAQISCEAVCHWLGSHRGQFAEVNTLWMPVFTATAVSYDIGSLEMLRLKQELDRRGLSLLAQVHSHPGSAFHSSRDDLTAASPWPGFISIVVPNFGRLSSSFLDSVECFELLGDCKWNHWNPKEKRRRLVIL